MKQSRRKHSPSFKAKVAMEALKAEQLLLHRLQAEANEHRTGYRSCPRLQIRS